MKIRKLRLSDLDDVLVIEKAVQFSPWSRTTFEDSLTRYHCRGISNRHDAIVAYVIASIIHVESEVLTLAVAPEYQRRGLGKMLLMHMIKVCRRCDIPEVVLEVRASNSAARKLYQHLGFQHNGCRKAYYPSKEGREDAINMSLQLSTSSKVPEHL